MMYLSEKLLRYTLILGRYPIIFKFNVLPSKCIQYTIQTSYFRSLFSNTVVNNFSFNKNNNFFRQLRLGSYRNLIKIANRMTIAIKLTSYASWSSADIG